jgi:pimeloyl-ACP methyl ester carboxylesterase
MEAEPAGRVASNPTLHAEMFGSVGPRLALLHGFGGVADVWHDIAERLSVNHRMIVYDLPGHGRSLNYPKAGPPKIAARAIADDLRSRGPGPLHLVGHSMGGAIAVLVALGAQDLVASLTLVAPGGMGEEINAPLLRRFGDAQSHHEIAACLKAMSTPGAPDPDPRAAVLAAARGSAEQHRKLVEIAELITRDGRQGVIPTNILASLSIPVSVLWGTDDPVLPYAQARNLPPNVEVTAIPGAGHMLIEEAPQAIIATLLRQSSMSVA